MPLLPTTDLPKLKHAFAAGRFPDDGTEEADFLYSFVSELYCAVAEDAYEPGASAARSELSTVLGMWDAIPWDGVLTGIVINQAQLLPPAIAAAESMGLAPHAALLRQILDLIPASLIEMDIDARLAWTQSPEREAIDPKLDASGDQAEEWDFRCPLYEACFRRLLAEPAQFFEA